MTGKRRAPKYPGIKRKTAASEPEAVEAKSAPEFTSRDLKDMSRLTGKYGLKRVLAKFEEIPPPRPRHRPKADPQELPEHLEDIVYCIWKWAEEYLAEGSKRPVEDAFRDLYEVTVEDEKQRMRGHYERWVQTTKRKRSTIRRAFESYLERARATAPLLHGKKPGAD
jgi:hypothetical protein